MAPRQFKPRSPFRANRKNPPSSSQIRKALISLQKGPPEIPHRTTDPFRPHHLLPVIITTTGTKSMNADDAEELPTSTRRADEETIGRKRARRVSFAETTAVHVFDRDEDYDTPPDSSKPAATVSGVVGQPLEFRGDPAESDEERGASVRGEAVGVEDEEDEDEEEEEEHELFVKDMDFSPGSAVGSVTSNDDDNLFGPVSVSFLKSGHLSEASEDNTHDITLDSTAFSLHFRNALPSDDPYPSSAGSFKTPTGDSISNDPGSFMSLTGVKRPVSRSTPPSELSSDYAGNSSSMSFITENPKKYDYGKLSPTLEALLVKVNESMQTESPKSNIKSDTIEPKHSGHENSDRANGTKSPVNEPNSGNAKATISNDSESIQAGLADIQSNSKATSPNIGVNGTNNAMFTAANKIVQKDLFEEKELNIMPFDTSNTAVLFSPNKETLLSFENDHLSYSHFVNQTSVSPHKLNPLPVSTWNASNVVVSDGWNQQLEVLEADLQTPIAATDQRILSPFEGSVSSLRAKRRELFSDPSILSPSQHAQSSTRGLFPYSLEMDVIRHSERISAIKNSIAKIKSLEGLEKGILESKSLLPSPNKLSSWFEEVAEKSLDFPTEMPGVYSTTTCGGNSVNDSGKASKLNFNSETSLPGSLSPNNFQISTSPNAYRMVATTGEIQFLSSQKVQPKGKEPYQPTMNDNMGVILPVDSVPNFIQGSALSSNDDRQDPHALEESSSIAAVDISQKKRKGQDLHSTDMNETGRILKSQKVALEFEGRSCDLLTGHHDHVVRSEAHGVEIVAHAKAWNEILSKVSEITLQEFSPSISMLNSKEIDKFEDMLGELQRKIKIERLCNDVQSTWKHCNPDVKYQQRVAEAKHLQDRILYQRAKLKLMHATRDGLLKKVERLQLGIQESDKLRRVSVDNHWSKKDHIKNCHFQYISTYPFFNSQEKQDRVTLIKEEIVTLERRLNEFITFFEASCKIKGDGSYDEIVNKVIGYLDKRTQCHTICRDLLLWELTDVVSQKDEHHILLSYQNVLLQRFSIKAAKSSTLWYKNSWNDKSIVKRFPNLKASAAFNFIFNSTTSHKLDESTSFQHVTQTTNFILGNLLELLGEVQAAHIAITSLLHSTFYYPSACQLVLELSFFAFNSGNEVTLTLDMTNLKCGIYPSDPSELHLEVLESRTRTVSSISDEILAAIGRLECGPSMITRLCRCVSDILQASSYKVT